MLTEFRKINDKRIRAFCNEHRDDLVREVSALISKLTEVLDEQDLEDGLKAAEQVTPPRNRSRAS
jgi:predicted RNA-binding protein associated with RNAse of E/G family